MSRLSDYKNKLINKAYKTVFKGPYCNQPWNTFYVQWDGRQVMPCCYGPFQACNINETDFKSLWNGDYFKKVRRQLADNNVVSGTCLPCYKKERPFSDHIAPFLRGNLLHGPSNIKASNFNKARKNYSKGRLTVDSLPYVIYLDVSSKCNIRCQKCYVYAAKELWPLGNMSMATFNKIVPLLPTAIKVICTGIGESLANPNFMKMLRVIKENDCLVSFNSNGQLLNIEKCRQLVEDGVDEIVFSIDSIDDELYAYHHKGGTLKVLLDNLQHLKDLKESTGSFTPTMNWYFVAMKSNIQELTDIIHRASDLGFQSIYVAPLNPPVEGQKEDYFNYYKDENLISSKEDIELLKSEITKAEKIAADKNINFNSGHVMIE